MREFASRTWKSRTLSMHIDTQYVALVSHVCTTTRKGDSRLEEMSIEERCRNSSKSNAVARSWMLLSALRAANELLIIYTVHILYYIYCHIYYIHVYCTYIILYTLYIYNIYCTYILYILYTYILYTEHIYYIYCTYYIYVHIYYIHLHI